MTGRRIGGLAMVRHAAFRGGGYFAGLAADPAVPASPDGRLRILNAPARRRVSVVERSTLIAVDSTLSAADGTWAITGLDTTVNYLVLGLDGSGVQNAAVQDWVKPALPE